MQKSLQSEKIGSSGFALIDFIIIGTVIGILGFIVISNILAHAY